MVEPPASAKDFRPPERTDRHAITAATTPNRFQRDVRWFAIAGPSSAGWTPPISDRKPTVETCGGPSRETLQSRPKYGNHETYLLDFLRDPASLAEWQHNGGLETLMSYGLAPSLNPTSDDQKQLAALLAERLPTHHYDFLMTLPLSFDCGDYFFVHAGVRPGVALPDQRAEDLLLIREEFLLYKEALERPWSTAILR